MKKGKLKCYKCTQAPILRVSGYSPPKDLKCPICNTFYCYITKKTTEETKEIIDNYNTQLRKEIKKDSFEDYQKRMKKNYGWL